MSKKVTDQEYQNLTPTPKKNKNLFAFLDPCKVDKVSKNDKEKKKYAGGE